MHLNYVRDLPRTLSTNFTFSISGFAEDLAKINLKYLVFAQNLKNRDRQLHTKSQAYQHPNTKKPTPQNERPQHKDSFSVSGSHKMQTSDAGGGNQILSPQFGLSLQREYYVVH